MPSPQEREAALFALAVEKPSAERPALLQAVCSEDVAPNRGASRKQMPISKSSRKFVLATVVRRSQNHWFTVWLLAATFFLSAGWTRAEMGVQAWVQRYSHDTGSATENSPARPSNRTDAG